MAHLETIAFVNVESEQRLGASSKDSEDPFPLSLQKEHFDRLPLAVCCPQSTASSEPGSTKFSEPGSASEKGTTKGKETERLGRSHSGEVRSGSTYPRFVWRLAGRN